MSVEPVTIVVTITAEQFGSDTDALARTKAADELGLEEHQVICVSRDRAELTQEVLHEDGAVDADGVALSGIKEPATMTLSSTWAPVPVAHVEHRHPIPWPNIKLGRGSRWNGVIPSAKDATMPEEVTLISDGEKLVHLFSPEGQAVIASLHVPNQSESDGEAVG